MKTFLSLTLSAVALFALAMNLHSQAPAAAQEAAAPKSPMQILQAMKVKNAELLEKQTQTLLKLDDLEKDSGQLKIFGKRT